MFDAIERIWAVSWPRRRFKDAREFYCFMDQVIVDLGVAGFEQEKKSLQVLLHESAWTTGSELLGELGLALKKIHKEKWKSLPLRLRQEINDGLSYTQRCGY